MRVEVHGVALELVEGDITEQDTEAIANAANRYLAGGGGVDGAIHRAGGPEIMEQCRKLGGCATGDAKITMGGRLKARYVIHAVGPVYWQEEPERAAELLSSAGFWKWRRRMMCGACPFPRSAPVRTAIPWRKPRLWP